MKKTQSPDSPALGVSLTAAQRSALKKEVEERKKIIGEKRKALANKRLTLSPEEQSPEDEESARIQKAAEDLLAGLADVPSIEPKSPPKSPRTKKSSISLEKRDLYLEKTIGRPKLLKSEATETSIFPKAPNILQKSAQTDVMTVEPEVKVEEQKPEKITTKLLQPKPQFKIVTSALLSPRLSRLFSQSDLFDTDDKGNKPEVVDLDETQREEIMLSDSFERSLNKSIKMIERALGAGEMAAILPAFHRSDVTHQRDDKTQIKRLRQYQDSDKTLDRPVLDLQTSDVFPSLFIASYGPKSNASIRDPEGEVLLWDVVLENRPELAFSSLSAVTSCIFDPYRPQCVIGGTRSGGIQIWDSRVSSRPVKKTPFSLRSHGHPINFIDVKGSHNASTLVSLDADGRLCIWSLNQLSTPTEAVDLRKGNRELGVMCAGMQVGETSMLYGGAEDGSLFRTPIGGANTGVVEVLENSHYGPCTSIKWHPLIESQQTDCTGLCLSTSVDWSAKLWYPKESKQPLQTYECNEDYVMDCAWSPTNPSVFATCDTDGSVDLWKLSRDQDISTLRENTAQDSLNKVAFSKDGKCIMSGDLGGSIVAWGLSADLVEPRKEDWDFLENFIESARSR